MVRACLLGAVVTFVMIATPGIHFITGLPAAFVGGYLAGSRTEASAGTGLLIGLVMGLLIVAPLAGAFVAWFVVVWGSSVQFVLWLTGGIVTWVFLLGSLGAIMGGESVRKQRTAQL
jgi:hypothetical protein